MLNSGAQAFSLHSFRDFEPEHDRLERLIIKCADFCVQTARAQSAAEAFAVHTSELAVNVEGKPKNRLEQNETSYKKHLLLQSSRAQEKEPLMYFTVGGLRIVA